MSGKYGKAVVNTCTMCGGSRVGQFHHFLCNLCWTKNEKDKNRLSKFDKDGSNRKIHVKEFSKEDVAKAHKEFNNYTKNSHKKL